MLLRSLLGAAVAVLVAGSVNAEGTLTLRGGLSWAESEFPYAIDGTFGSTTGVVPIYSSYGDGGFAYVAYSHEDMFGSFGGEVSLSYQQMSGGDSYGLFPSNGAPCSPVVLDALSLSQAFCRDNASVSNTSSAGQIRVMGTTGNAESGVQALAGLSVLSFRSASSGTMELTGAFTDQYRRTKFSGIGPVVGLRKEFQLGRGVALNFEGFGGAYFGHQSLLIEDNYNGTPGSLSERRNETAYSLDLAVSVQVPADRIVQGAQLEFGVAATQLFGVADTSNRNPSVLAFGPELATGRRNDDYSSLSVFVGLQIPL